jgi:hypothetical protein
MTNTTLKPCPFCGGTDFTECLDGGIWPDYMYNGGGVPPSNEYVIRDEIMCNTCGTSVQSCSHGERLADVTPEEAEQNTYRLWNTRAERTCHDLGGCDEAGMQVFHCSECGCVLSLFDVSGTNTLCTNHIYDYPRYCPICGAKVVEP